jgi:3-hydroxybutyryl-CoA dehydrogenase
VVIEAVPKELDLKCEVLNSAAAAAGADAIIASNASQLGNITDRRRPRRCGAAGDRPPLLQPPVMMKLVEVIAGIRTAEETVDRACEFCASLGKETVLCRKDTPGFITTRAYLALRLECISILDEGIASAEDIDKAMKLGFNLPMGPLELGDFNGLDVNLKVMESLSEAYGERFLLVAGASTPPASKEVRMNNVLRNYT